MTINDPKPNLDLLRRVLKQIDEHPETWDQEIYAKKSACGSAFCIAGHAVVMSGQELIWQNDYDLDDKPIHAACRVKGGGFIDEAAKCFLGLTDDERADLFSSSNSRETIQMAAEQIAARAGEKL